MISQIICGFLGIFFLTSTFEKAKNRETFFSILKEYPIPQFLKAKPTAKLIFAFELLLAFLLLNLDNRAAFAGLFLSLIFLAAMTATIIIRLFRGEKRFRCGCAGEINKEQSVFVMLFGNLSLILLLLTGLRTFSASGSVFSFEIVSVYLIGIGLFVSLRLLSATTKAVRLMKEWKVSG